ncbi:CGNR zinc finger domain-containing protein [Streptacidiphilus sp. N1-3]|uniref:CGNR zinc finger domain-containing protein n=1 Tax=Streptacidiphilus alkalitolerans TaxID=3342712 RepID=A0ABV6X625_9ACTN
MAKPDAGLTGRFQLASAPAGLRLAQDLVNTAVSAKAGDPDADHLADIGTARAWLREALVHWADATGAAAVPEVELEEADLARLSEFREALRERLRASSDNAGPAPSAGPGPRERAADIRLSVMPDGRIEYQPLGVGAGAVAALVTMESLLAQTAGTLTRLKTCAHPVCGVCFYDTSPNRSRSWHDTKTCGNINNLRASRARRRSGGGDPVAAGAV